jgi:putative RNA 2'-phosphotransferase
MNATRTSKLLSLILRHDPASIGIELDSAGWVRVDVLLTALAKHGHPLTRAELDEIVATSPKQRFAYSADGLEIRANQGHSIDVDLELAATVPPEVLYHGTAAANLDSIFRIGLEKRSRHHVHLSAETDTARTVGSRHGRPIVLRVDAARRHADGVLFYLSANGVWLVDAVAPSYLQVVGDARDERS